MKKIIFAACAAAVALASVSCNKNLSAPSIPVEGDGSPINVEVKIGPSTRVTGITDNDVTTEAKVNTLQVFVFNNDALDGYATSTAKTATVSCSAGLRDIWAVVNAPDLSAITSKAALLATVSTLSEEISNFQMIGSKTETLKFDGSVMINVDRLAARVVVKGIKNAIKNAAQANAFKLLGIYLTNITGDVNYGLSTDYSVTKWYNQRGYQAANNLGSFSYDAIDATLAADATHDTAHYFYTYPNHYDAKTGGPWSGRAARIVIKAEIAGVVFDYPILLPEIENNKSYEIKVVNITRAGNLDDGKEPTDGTPDDKDEEEEVIGIDQDIEIIVNDWTTVLVGEEGEKTI